METSKIILIIQFIVSVFLIATILLQQRGAGTSAFMGGGGTSYYSKRGLEKNLFTATIILAILFVALGIASIVIK